MMDIYQGISRFLLTQDQCRLSLFICGYQGIIFVLVSNFSEGTSEEIERLRLHVYLYLYSAFMDPGSKFNIKVSNFDGSPHLVAA